MGKWTPGDVAAIITNPFYAIDFDPELCEPHELLVKEEVWISTNVDAIAEVGSERWLRQLLSTLKGGGASSKASFSPNDTGTLVANPHPAVEIHPMLAEPHEALVPEDTWVAANVNAIEEAGAESWLRNLLVALKGATLVEDTPSEPSISGAGRNDPYPCGSGLKYKRCHGA